MPVVLVEIPVLVIALVCIALALLIVEIMRKVGDLVRPIWLIGGTIADGVDALAQGITSVLGKAESGIDSALGASWHALAWFAREWWHLIEDSALGYLGLAELVARLVYQHTGLRSLVHFATATLHGIEHGVRDLTRAWRGIEHRVGRLEREVANGIGNDLRTGLRDVEKELHGIEHGTIPAVRRGLDAAEGELTQLENFIKAIPGTSYLTWAKGIALAGLAALGLKGLTCDNNPLKGKDCNSNVWGDLESLLGLAASVLVVADFETLVHEMQALTEDAVTVFTDAVGLG